MIAAKILKIAVIAEIALIPIGVAVSYWADSFLSAEALSFEENEAYALGDLQSIGVGSIFLIIGGTLMFGAWIASIIGLLKLRVWGAWLYLFSTILALPIYLIFGIDVRHPIDQIFDDIYRFIPGFVIALAFFSDAIPKTRNKKSEQGGDGDAREAV